MQQFRQVADVQTMETLKLPVPEIETVKPIIVRAPATAELKEFVASLANPTWRIREGRKAQVLENQRPNFLGLHYRTTFARRLGSSDFWRRLGWQLQFEPLQ